VEALEACAPAEVFAEVAEVVEKVASCGLISWMKG
jgi:hypothetical protein